jgi:hypothetical protein
LDDAVGGIDAGALAVPMCGERASNIDPAHLTRLVISGTTALTGRTAERIDDHGIADTIRYIKPFFVDSDLVHTQRGRSSATGCGRGSR